MTGKTPKLSVVIPTLGRPILIQTLESLAASQGFEDCEVFVAGSVADLDVASKLQELLGRHPNVRHLDISFKSGDSSRKKNAGWQASTADIVAFLDDDVVVAPDWPIRIAEPFKDPAVGLVTGPSLVPDDVTGMARLAGVALASKAAGYVAERYLKAKDPMRHAKWSLIIGCNMAFRRTVLNELGGFNPAFWPGEEMIASFAAARRGYVMVFHSDAWVYHYPRQSLTRFCRQMYGYGATRIRLFRGGVEFEPTTIVPALWVLSLFVLGLGTLFSKLSFQLLLLNLALYALAAVAITLHKFAETRRPFDLLMVFIIPVMHVVYGMAEWAELLLPDYDLSEQRKTGKTV